jgi:transcriptional regulator with XRE-family HTH domain
MEDPSKSNPHPHPHPHPNDKLRNARLRRGWSRDYVAEKIGSNDSQSIGRWERGTTHPNPFYRQALCELFGMNAEELGLMQSETKDAPSPEHFTLNPRIVFSFVAIGAIIATTSILLVAIFTLRLLAPPLVSPLIEPGGLWVSPKQGQVVGSTFIFAARAYPTNPGDPPIEYVTFTVNWEGGAWETACIARPPAIETVYSCQANLANLGIPPGILKISFDVYDQMGNVNKAPNGEHIVIYTPSGLLPIPLLPVPRTGWGQSLAVARRPVVIHAHIP